MIINISSDNIYIHDGVEMLCVPRWGLEIQLPQIMYHLHAQGRIGKEIFVINGPGSFTNLRIGCLVLNMLKDFGLDVQLYTVAKMDIYNILWRDDLVPPKGILYIGQQKNYWSVDFATGACEKAQIDLTQLDGHFDGAYRVDQASSLVSDYIVSYALTSNNQIAFSYQGKQRVGHPQALWFEKVDTLVPNYILQPNISTPKTQV